MYRDNPILEIACIVTAIVMLVGFIYGFNTVDLGSYSYDKVNQFLIDVPSVKPLVSEALADGVLTQNEFNDIKEYVSDEPKRIVLSKIEGAE
ncbi:hypothetical protein [Vibrio parahaemolyticus]|uniref:hypothetical protein n=1 Tax=Vibrio parahaemolyticus TaxID=670 RepID=UPI00112360DA|nr:hypothetical protein [Vibrio parahaemolyticus]TOG40352.1 hypothetical protein CGJ02_16095 [Vibrio parahaemolyticus]